MNRELLCSFKQNETKQRDGFCSRNGKWTGVGCCRGCGEDGIGGDVSFKEWNGQRRGLRWEALPGEISPKAVVQGMGDRVGKGRLEF